MLHFANLPFSRHFVAVGFAVGHLVNLPLASLHGAAIVGVATSDSVAAASSSFIMHSLLADESAGEEYLFGYPGQVGSIAVDDVLFLYQIACMARFATLTPDADIAASILNAPGWARVGITMPDRDMRKRAADELARSIVEQLSRPEQAENTSQLPLPI